MLVSSVSFSGLSVVFGAEKTYTLVDNFGRAPLVRSITDDAEIVSLSDEHKDYSKYGRAVTLKSTSGSREYVTYDVESVIGAEISAIIRQSDFGSNHGWGYSLGVTNEIQDQPLNNIENINLQNVFPIYLSSDGIPFIYAQNKWWCYIAGVKYSFVPSDTNVTEGLRPFTVPDVVKGEIDEDGFTVIEKGYRYPMINLEYYDTEKDVWTAMVSDATNYRIKNAEYIGGEKYYYVTVTISNVPETASKIRVGMDYIRKTLKASSAGDTDPDVYESFPIPFNEAIYLTNVKLTMKNAYAGEWESLEQTGIRVDASANQIFAYGEDFTSEEVVFYDVYNGGIDEANYDTDDFTLTVNGYDKYNAGIYEVNVKKGDYQTKYYVEVLRPDELILDLSGVTLNVSKGSPFDVSEITVAKARTNVGSRKDPVWKEYNVPVNSLSIDVSEIDYDKAGEYNVIVKVGSGVDTVSTSFTVKVITEETTGNGGCGCKGDASSTSFVGLATLGIIGLFMFYNIKRRNEND